MKENLTIATKVLVVTHPPSSLACSVAPNSLALDFLRLISVKRDPTRPTIRGLRSAMAINR